MFLLPNITNLPHLPDGCNDIANGKGGEEITELVVDDNKGSNDSRYSLFIEGKSNSDDDADASTSNVLPSNNAGNLISTLNYF